MSSPITLSYERLDRTRCRARLSTPDGRYADLEAITFEQMITAVRQTAQRFPASSIVFHRTDRQGLRPVEIDRQLTHLFRTGTQEEVMQALTPVQSPPIEEVLKRVRAQRVRLAENPPPVLPRPPSGYPEFVDMFGDVVYARRSIDGLCECPVCGFFSPVGSDVFTCVKKCRNDFRVVRLQHWLRFSVADLLTCHTNRFFLPRMWNDPGPWISHRDLTSRLQDLKDNPA